MDLRSAGGPLPRRLPRRDAPLHRAPDIPVATVIGSGRHGGLVAIELDRQTRISRLISVWDGSLVDAARITTLMRAAVEH